MNKISFKTKSNCTEIYYDNNLIAKANKNNQDIDSFIMLDENVVCWKRSCGKPVSQMAMQLESQYKCEYKMLPAVQYNWNNEPIKDYVDVRNETLPNNKKVKKEKPLYFKGDYDETSGKSWVIAWHRTSVPGGMYSEGEKYSTGMFLPDDQLDGACLMKCEDNKTLHKMIWPEQENPYFVYKGSEKIENYKLKIKPRKIFRVILVFDKVKQRNHNWHRLLNVAWKHYYRLKCSEHSYKELWDLGISYTKKLYTKENDEFSGFSIGFTWNGEKWIKRKDQKYEIGWCGQNASLAVSLIYNHILNDDEESLKMAMSVLDSWINAKSDKGIIPTHYDENIYTNGFEKTIDACNLGTVAIQYFIAYNKLKELNIIKEEYYNMAIRICDFAIEKMNDKGRIGKSWIEKTHESAVEEGTTGAFLTMSLAYIAKQTDNNYYLKAAQKSLDYYISELNEKGYTTGGALDIFTIDKESAIPLLRSAILIYEITKNEKYIEYAKEAAWYLSTWQWHYTKDFSEDSILGKMNYDTFGGTAVSIHGGMDPYALMYANDLYDLGEITNENQWIERAKAIWRNGQQGISNGNLIIDKKAPRPKGSQDESISPTFGRFYEKPSQWLVAWPSAFRLETLRDIICIDSKRVNRIL